MQKGTTIAISLVLAASALAESAYAASHFETGKEAPLAASVRLNFTILIPEILTLRIDPRDAATDALQSPWALRVPAMAVRADGLEPDPTTLPRAVASSNAGTLATGTGAAESTHPGEGAQANPPVQVSLAQPDDRPLLRSIEPTVSLDTHSAAFLVALP
ncbi:hypothetical protein [Blastomonas fulva]|jgi:hypothetical protein|uniref:hypothetical protein n=1 Tax=Blastomonas fulva TaxID=1550728 RepID=UPI003D2B5B69